MKQGERKEREGEGRRGRRREKEGEEIGGEEVFASDPSQRQC